MIIDGFYKMIQVTGGRDGFGVHSLEYYRRAYELFHPTGMCELLVAEFENKPLAALMVFARGKRAWYIYGASNDEERNRMPTYLLQWEAMRWARAKGVEEYDLWGVPDEDEATLEAQFENRNDGLWGVYRFKRGFGGELKRAAQAMDKIYNPLFIPTLSLAFGRTRGWIMQMPIWNQLISLLPNSHFLQTHEWAQVKSKYGWKPIYLIWSDRAFQSYTSDQLDQLDQSNINAACLVLKRTISFPRIVSGECSLYAQRPVAELVERITSQSSLG